MFGIMQKVLEKLPCAVQKAVEKLQCVVEKQHPAIGAEEGEPLQDCSRQPEKGGGNEHGSVDELRPGSPMETSGFEKSVVEPHAYDNKTTKRGHEVKT